MSKLKAKWLFHDTNTLEDNVGTLRVKLDAAGALESTASGLDVKDSGITELRIDPNYRAELIRRDGTVDFTDDQSMGNNKITNLLPGIDPNDAVNVSQLDSAVTGLTWRVPVDEAEVDSDLLDLFDASSSGGGNYAGFRVLINGIGLNDFAGHDNEIAERNEADTNWIFYTPVAGWAVFDKETENGYVYDSDGTQWVQFTGAGQVNAGAGLVKSGNTINVGQNSTGGITVSSNDIAVNVDNSTIEVNGTNPGALRVKAGGITANELDLTDTYDFATNSGVINVTTQVPSTNSTLAASTAYVDAAVVAATGKIKKHEMFLISAGDVTVGYVTLASTPHESLNVSMFVQYGPSQVSKKVIGATGSTPDFDILNSNQLHFNNNGAATGLSEDVSAGDIIDVVYFA